MATLKRIDNPYHLTYLHGPIAPIPPAYDSPPAAAVHLGWSRRAAVPAARETACTRAKGETAPGRTAGRVKRRPHLTRTREAGPPRPDRRSLPPSSSLMPPPPGNAAEPAAWRRKAASCGEDGEGSALPAGMPPQRTARARRVPTPGNQGAPLTDETNPGASPGSLARPPRRWSCCN